MNDMIRHLKPIPRLLQLSVVILVIIFAFIQIVQVERSNPPVVSEPEWSSPEARAIVEHACFDCHSNETVWPWYSNVAPVSWVVAHHTNDGRGEFNFSDWERNPAESEDLLEAVKFGEMPLRGYLALHPEARLNSDEMSMLLQELQAIGVADN